jgi:hypothetical protein
MRSPVAFPKLRENHVAVAFVVVGVVILLPYLVIPSSDDLSSRDVARIAEFQHLRQTVGETIWPGFGKGQIPLALVKGKMEYLFDHPSPPSGYKPVRIPSYPGAVFRRKGHTLPRLAMTAIPVGGVLAALMPDKATFDQVASVLELNSDSSVLEAAMSGGVDTVDTAVYEVVAIHEGFHAFQIKRDIARLQRMSDLPPGSLDEKLFAARLKEAEATTEITKLLRVESRHLALALAAGSPGVRRDEAQLFLEARDARRQATAAKAEGLTIASVAVHENAIEWCEGMATYVEGQTCRLAAGNSYKPLDLMAGLSDFHGYASLAKSKDWSLDRSADMASHARSYVVGAGICLLLDRLGAEWKKPAIEELLPLDELLRRALESR